MACGSTERTTATPAKAPPSIAPPRAVEEEPPGLVESQIIPIVEAHYSRVRGCHTIEYSGRDATAGTITVDIDILPDGTVARAVVTESDYDSEQMQSCVLDVTRLLQFPTAPGSTELSWRFKFKAPQG